MYHSRLSAVAFLLIFAALWSGCDRHPPAAPAPLLRVSQRNEPATLDPHLATLPDEFVFLRTLLEGLVVPDPAGGPPRPGAAESWTTSVDGLVWTFKLRADARWSDGSPVTAGDFVYSFRRALNPALAAPKAQLFFALKNAAALYRNQLSDPQLLGATAPDARTLILTLERPTPQLLALAASGAWLPVHPPSVEKFGGSTARDGAWTHPGNYVGNGPFILREWRPSQHLLIARNPHYHAAAAVKLSEVRFQIYDTSDTEERAFRAGQLDVTMAVPFSKLSTYSAPILRRAALHETRYLVLNTTRAPLNDPRVRRALSLALDRDALVRSVLRGAQRPALSFIPPGLGGYTGTTQLAADPAAARALLAEAGFANGKDFPRLEFSAWGVNPAILEAIQQMWRRELGLETSIVQREGKVHLAAVSAGDFTIALMPAIPDYDDAAALFDELATGASGNFPRWSDARYDDLVRRADRETDPLRRTALYREAEQVMLGQMPIVPLYFNAQDYLLSPRVTGWRQDALWNRFYEDVSVRPENQP